MRRTILATFAAVLISVSTSAEFRQFEDYTLSDEITHMSTIKVDAGKGEQYLEGLAQTWIESSQVAKDLGQIKDFAVYVSRLPESGDFNVVTIITLNKMQDWVVTKKQNAAFMKKWGEKRRKASTETAKSYPELRTITGEYLFSRLEVK